MHCQAVFILLALVGVSYGTPPIQPRKYLELSEAENSVISAPFNSSLNSTETSSAEDFSSPETEVSDNLHRAQILRAQSTGCPVKHTFPPGYKYAFLLESPDYPQNYQMAASCFYDLTSPVGTRMTIQCNDFQVPCASDSLLISLSGESNIRSGPGVCGSGPTTKMTTTGNRLTLSLQSRFSFLFLSARRYQCSVTVIENTGPGLPRPPSPPPAPGPAPVQPPNCKCGSTSAVRTIYLLVFLNPYLTIYERND